MLGPSHALRTLGPHLLRHGPGDRSVTTKQACLRVDVSLTQYVEDGARRVRYVATVEYEPSEALGPFAREIERANQELAKFVNIEIPGVVEHFFRRTERDILFAASPAIPPRVEFEFEPRVAKVTATGYEIEGSHVEGDWGVAVAAPGVTRTLAVNIFCFLEGTFASRARDDFVKTFRPHMDTITIYGLSRARRLNLVYYIDAETSQEFERIKREAAKRARDLKKHKSSKTLREFRASAGLLLSLEQLSLLKIEDVVR